MMLPAIVIGLGSTGRRTVEYLQTMMFARYKGNLGDLDYFLKLLVFDTVEEGRVDWLPIPESTISYAPLVSQQPGGRDGMFGALNQPKWCTESAVSGAAKVEDGAMQNRPLGRLVLWHQFGDVMHKIDEALLGIQNTQTNIGNYATQLGNLNIQASQLSQNISVFIVGSLTGGTCSSTFIDIAHYAYTQISQKSYAIFYVPPTSRPGWQENENDYRGAMECAWSALGDLNYQWNVPLDNESEKPPMAGAWRDDPPLFQKIGLMAPTSDAFSFPSRETMEKVGAFFVYLNIWENIQANIGAQLPAIFSFGISGAYEPSFETSAYAGMHRICECIEKTTTEETSYGNKPQRKAVTYKKELLKLVRQKLRNNVPLKMPSDTTEIQRTIRDIDIGLADNRADAIEAAIRKLDDDVIQMIIGESDGKLKYVMSFLDALIGLLAEMKDLYSSVVPSEDEGGIKQLSPSFGLWAWQIKNDRWDNLVETMILRECRDILDRVQNHVRETKEKIESFKKELSNLRVTVQDWQRALSQPLNPAGVTADYKRGTVEKDADDLIKAVGAIPENPLMNDSGLHFDVASLKNILDSPIERVPINTKKALTDKSVKNALVNFLGRSSQSRLAGANGAPTSCYLEFRNNFNKGPIRVPINAQFNSSTNSAYKYSVRLTYFNLQSTQGSPLSGKIGLAKAIKPANITKDDLEKRKCTLYWNKILTQIVALTSFVLCDYGGTRGQYSKTGIKRGVTQFKISPSDGMQVHLENGGWMSLDALEDSDFVFLGKTLKGEVSAAGIQVKDVLATLLTNRVIEDNNKMTELLATWDSIQEGVYLW
jgi:hypothetical protein